MFFPIKLEIYWLVERQEHLCKLFTKSVTIMQPPYVLYFIVLYNFCISLPSNILIHYIYFFNWTQVVRAVLYAFVRKVFLLLVYYIALDYVMQISHGS